MRISSTLCHQQEAHQRQIAQDHPLESRRKIATIAANAWAIEAIEAEKRESGHISALNKLDAEIALEFVTEAENDEKDLPPERE